MGDCFSQSTHDQVISHAIILTGIYGDGTAKGTTVTFFNPDPTASDKYKDPNTGLYKLPFDKFIQWFEDLQCPPIPNNKKCDRGPLITQIIHF